MRKAQTSTASERRKIYPVRYTFRGLAAESEFAGHSVAEGIDAADALKRFKRENPNLLMAEIVD